MLHTELVPAVDNKSRRLMVVMHGLGDSMEGYRWLPEELDLPWLNYLLVNAPDEYYGGYSWFDITGDLAPGVARSYRMIKDLMDTQRAAGFPTGETLLFGFSQGCFMAWETGLRYPHKFAGLIGISGGVPNPHRLLQEKSAAALEQRFLITHGTLDPLLPFDNAKNQVMQMKQAGVNVQWHEFQKQHTIAGRQELDLIRQFINDAYVAPGT